MEHNTNGKESLGGVRNTNDAERMSQAAANVKPSTAIADFARPLAVGFGDGLGGLDDLTKNGLIRV